MPEKKSYPLTAFEKYMILDDHPGYPMVVLMEWAFLGKINREKLSTAYNRVIQNEPLFLTKLEKIKKKYYWVEQDSPSIELLFETGQGSVQAEEGTYFVPSISPFEANGKIIVREYQDGVLFLVYAHHSVGDGIGVNEFFSTWLKEYDLLLHDKETPSKENAYPDVSLFSHREEPHFTPPEKVSFWKSLRDTVSGIAEWFCRRPFPLIEYKSLDSPPALQSPMYWRHISEDFFLKYKSSAKSCGVSVNSMMMRDMYITLTKWFEQRYPDGKSLYSDRRWLRMLVPMNLRTDFHQKMSCANILGYIFMNRKPNQCNRSAEFLSKIQSDMTFYRTWNVGAAFVDGIHIVDSIPGLLERITTDRYCHSTVVLSSVGNLCKSSAQEEFRKNDDIHIEGEFPLTLIRMLGAPPTRPHTPLSFGVVQHKNDMFISCRYDSNVMDENVMKEFFDLYILEMTQSLERPVDKDGNR